MKFIRNARLSLLFAGLLAGCTPTLSPPELAQPAQAPAGFPAAYYRQAQAAGITVLRVDTQRSRVTIKVGRGGVLARLGHEHVVASHDVNGYIDISAGQADLYVPLDRLVVDEPSLRREAGFTTQPSDDAIAGTQHNMQLKVLESARFPFALIHIKRGSADDSKLDVTITLHNTAKTFEVPALIETVTDGLKISGQLSFNQTDFGMTPFSILGGALQVQDRVDLHFLIFAVARS